MKKERFKLIAAVYIFFRQGDKVLLSRRFNTGYEDGNYGLVAGCIDGDEPLTQAMAREAQEEVGVKIDPKDLVLKTVMHWREDVERLDFFFEPKKWQGEIKNMEPHKCDDLSWFPLDQLPDNVIPYIRQALDCYRQGIIYSEFWMPQ